MGYLERRDLQGLRVWAGQDRGVVAALLGLIAGTDPLLRWRAIEALGEVAAALATQDPEPVRDLVRRQLWSMNDESGGIAWHAPEIIGEILHRVPSLASPFISILASHVDTYPYSAGVCWALGRLSCGPARAQVLPQAGTLIRTLGSRDPAVRAQAAVALGRLGHLEAQDLLRPLTEDRTEVELYDLDSGELRVATVGELALRALSAPPRAADFAKNT